jgi:formylglycine-generating enzyme required for sulfatase activity
VREPLMPVATAVGVIAAVLVGHAAGVGPSALPPGMARIVAGTYRPLYARPAVAGAAGGRRVAVAAFAIDVHAVTNADYLAFVRLHPEWRRSRVKAIAADGGYLRHWAGDLELGDDAPAGSPVVNVSWFAARAYLHALGKELPTVDQWEYVAAASATKRDASRDPAFLAQLRQWYARPIPDRLPLAAAAPANAYGVAGMHAVVWEWTLDFNSSLVTGESRADGDLDRSLYCGAGAATAADFEDYAAFMRYAFRSSLEARYTVGNLGFRGVVVPEESR